MPAPAPTPGDVNQWLYATIGGLPTPGTIPSGGVKGFARETGWDEQKGKGTQGARLTLTTAPPCKGTITLHLIGPGGFYATGKPSIDFALWDIFVASVLSIAPQKQQAQGLTFSYAGLASVGLTNVVVKYYSPLEHVGKGLYKVEIELIEWVQPPPASIVSTVSKTKPDAADPNDVPLPDPRVAILKARIATASAANQP